MEVGVSDILLIVICAAFITFVCSMIGKFCSEKIYEILASQIAEEVCKKNKEVIGNHNLKKMCWEPGSN